VIGKPEPHPLKGGEAFFMKDIQMQALKYDISEAEIQALEAESMCWLYLSEGAYLHEGSDKSGVIQVVGIAQPSMSESTILWLL